MGSVMDLIRQLRAATWWLLVVIWRCAVAIYRSAVECRRRISTAIRGFWSVVRENEADWRDGVWFQREDGLLINCMRFVFLFSLPIHYLFLLVVTVFGVVLSIATCLGRKRDVSQIGRETWRLATDLYMITVSALLVWSYFRIVEYCCNNPNLVGWRNALFVPVFVTVARIFEICSFTAALHTKKDYKTDAPMRALVNLFWEYCEIVVAFASLFLLTGYAHGDQFGKQLLSGSNVLFGPLYFSFVTITTLGYGDFSPETSIGWCLVMLEVFLGLILLIVAVQRVLAVNADEG
jgi:hypothetical protein